MELGQRYQIAYTGCDIGAAGCLECLIIGSQAGNILRDIQGSTETSAIQRASESKHFPPADCVGTVQWEIKEAISKVSLVQFEIAVL